MSNAKSLDFGQKHLLRLVDKDAGDDGWAPVSATVWPLLKEMPKELIHLEALANGGGRVRLTELGRGLLVAMEWL